MASSLLRTSARSVFAILERNFANRTVYTANTKINFCGCTSTSVFDIHSRYFATRQYSEFTKPKRQQRHEESESDEEVSKKPGESNFWRRKMRTFHSILDLNKDGVISFDDFSLLADRFVNLGHISDAKSREFRKLIKTTWEKQWGEISPYNLVTVEQYLEDMLHVINDKDRAQRVHAFLPYLFEAVDKDNSGQITVEEFKLFFECLGHSSEDAVFTFRVIDANANGKLSMKEFVKHGKEFFLTEDESKVSKYFWGPMVEK